MIRTKKQIFLGILAVLLVIVIGTNPREKHYLNRISYDYGRFHGGLQLSASDLKSMGTYKKNNYLVFSEFDYKFGSMSVKYVGFAGKIWFVESYREKSLPIKNI